MWQGVQGRNAKEVTLAMSTGNDLNCDTWFVSVLDTWGKGAKLLIYCFDICERPFVRKILVGIVFIESPYVLPPLAECTRSP